MHTAKAVIFSKSKFMQNVYKTCYVNSEVSQAGVYGHRGRKGCDAVSEGTAEFIIRVE